MPAPLTPAEELEIALLLGYPADYANENPLFYGAFQRINNKPANYDKAISFLVEAAALQTAISNAASSAGIQSLDKGDIVFFGNANSGNTQFQDLQTQLRTLIHRLSAFCGVTILNDITTGAGPLNSVYAGPLPGAAGAAPQW